MAFKKGKRKTGGRKKGTPNKVPIAAKQAMMAAFAEVGGVAALVAWARRHKTEFYKLWSKTLPREITGPDGGPIPFADLSTDALREELQRIREARASAGAGAGAGAAPPGNG